MSGTPAVRIAGRAVPHRRRLGRRPGLTSNSTPSLRGVSITVRGPTRIPAGELREAEVTWYSIGERGGIDGDPLEGDFHLRAEARIRAGLHRPVTLPTAARSAPR